MLNPLSRSLVSSIKSSSAFSRVCWLLALLMIALGAVWLSKTSAQNASAGQTQTTTQEVTTLEVGKPIERELAGGQSHTYQITLADGQYLNVVVEQRGIDVMVRLLGPDGKQVAEFDAEIRTQGQEVMSQVAETAGNYRLVVQAKQKDAPAGRIELRVAELRAATEKDRELQEAQKLHTESDRLRRAGKYEDARPLAERALAIRERVLGPEHQLVAASRFNLANLYYDKNDYVKAELLYQRALAIREKALGPEHPDVASSLYNLANLYRDKADYSKAEPIYQRALATWEEALGPEHPAVAASLNNLAKLYHNKDDYVKAEPLYQRALAIYEKARGPEHPDVATLLNNLAVLYDNKGDYMKAEQIYQRALAIREKSLGPEHSAVAASLNNLAGLYYGKGNYVKAEPLYQRALAIWEKTRGPEHLNVATSLNNLALLYRDKGDYVKAEPLYLRALAIEEKALGPEHPDVATSLINLAALHRAKGDYVKAEPLYQRALAILEKALGPEHQLVATSLNNLANLYSVKGDFVKAEPLYQRALAIREKGLGVEHPTVAGLLHNLALLYSVKGDYVKAEPLHRRALAIREKARGPEHPTVAGSLHGLATLYTASGDLPKALSFRLRAATVSERNIGLNLATGSERQKLAYLATLAEETDRIVSLHAGSLPSDATARELALMTILQRKGRALDAMTDILAVLRQRADPQDQPLFDQLKETTSQLARLVLNGPERLTSAEHQQRIRVLEDQKEKLEADLSNRRAEFRQQLQPVTVAAVQAKIPDKAALVEFFVYRPFNAKYQKEDEAFGPARYVAYVLRPQAEVQWVELGETKAIDSAIENLRQALRDPKRMDAKRLARKVDRMMMQPLRPLLGTTRHVLLSPDSVLNLVPFAALVDEYSQYLIHRYTFTYLTGGRDLLRLQIKQESKSVAFVLADPAFDSQPTAGSLAQRDIKPVYGGTQSGVLSTDFANAKFKSLPGTAGEAQALKQLLPDATVLTREQATEAALKQVSRPRLLHIATHGFFLPDLKPNAGNAGNGEAATNTRMENPLLRSGLALAGANLHKDANDDGILTALEATGLDLWGTKLVVLSACNTGVGDVRNGDGVYGLRRALVLAGSETQVMSLWSVSDQGTKELMVEYYRRLLRGEGRGEALRQVQLQMLKNPARRHPFYWASFIQSGEWANLDGKR